MYTTIRDQLIAKGKAEGKAEGKTEGKAEGKAEGFAQALESLLDSRGFLLSEDLRARIAGCEDAALLQRWFNRALTASSLTEVFDD